VARLVDVRVTKVSPAGRVVGLELVGESGEATPVTGFAVRDLLGLPDLRADLAVERDPAGRLSAIVATGRGWGHGVGLCQIGAFGMALLGRSAEEILGHYYPGTTLADEGTVDIPEASEPVP
jgi:stage II sporulation protein D